MKDNPRCWVPYRMSRGGAMVRGNLRVVAAGALGVIRGLLGGRPSSYWNLSPNRSGDDSTLGRDSFTLPRVVGIAWHRVPGRRESPPLAGGLGIRSRSTPGVGADRLDRSVTMTGGRESERAAPPVQSAVTRSLCSHTSASSARPLRTFRSTVTTMSLAPSPSRSTISSPVIRVPVR